MWKVAAIGVDAPPRSYPFNGVVDDGGHRADNTASRLNWLQPNIQFKRGRERDQRAHGSFGLTGENQGNQSFWKLGPASHRPRVQTEVVCGLRKAGDQVLLVHEASKPRMNSKVA